MTGLALSSDVDITRTWVGLVTSDEGWRIFTYGSVRSTLVDTGARSDVGDITRTWVRSLKRGAHSGVVHWNHDVAVLVVTV